ncbi:palmitoyltransferase ZDHHC4 isoform X2 [Heptranchias perlo]|uniref:palmitoyltransferase ZDHHC4 isoform X2 n=1 Tax=Heptranchias perlo TaxID=212740 RepID=UPI00355A3B42
MDFLILFLIYLAICLSCMVVAIKFSRQSQEYFARISHHVIQVIRPVIPQWLQVAVQLALHRLIHRRNSFFLVLHLVLEVVVYGVYSWEVVPYCLELGFRHSILLLPYILLLGKMYFFYLCCTRDPGTISPSNLKQLLKVYTYDGTLYRRDRVCPTCELMKPARSKHCRVCDRCVHRFDHHCVWVNNCVGGLNIRYFLLYLVTLSGMAAAVGTMTKLFLTFPRILFMLGFTLLTFFLLAGYTAFHCYLVMTNQTSNEWYKHKNSCHVDNSWSDKRTWENIYHRGFVANVKEIISPETVQKKIR